ncbi:MAG: dihydroceramide fatty acyl 2-hydroxylase [Chloroflexota bacterium]|nr:dihydroceramide fatty acyl 2-hydroxylase [Chloroflexota bacterium]
MSRTSNTLEINHSDQPIRLFKSDILEFFTHIHPAVVVVIWLPVAAFFLWRGGASLPAGVSWAVVPIGFVLGVFLWTLAEYVVHRFVFHYDPKGERMQKFFFLFHGVHHAQPQLKTRLVMPPVISIPMAAAFYGLFALIFGALLAAPHWAAPVFSGFILGYLVYDMIHYATHHWPMRSGYLKFLKRYHMAHHFKKPNASYGVSSPLWDMVFKTRPA